MAGMTTERQCMGGERSCGNCPGRRENLRSSVCDAHGILPFALFPEGGYDMIRPEECKRKPRNKTEVWKRRAEQRIAEQNAAQRTGEG